MKKEITLTVNDVDIDFVVDAFTYEKYLDEVRQSKKVGPSKNFVTRCVTEGSKAKLKEVMSECPSAVFEIIEALIEEYTPDVTVTVKKSKAKPSSTETAA